jgi:hypothetical protein
MTKSLAELAAAARPRNDDDWGTPRQVRAQNTFFAVVRGQISPRSFANLEAYCLKATTDEMIDAALVAVAKREMRDADQRLRAARRAGYVNDLDPQPGDWNPDKDI